MTTGSKVTETEGQRIKREAVERRNATFAYYEGLIYGRPPEKAPWWVMLFMFGVPLGGFIAALIVASSGR